jgi:hypothetical protein
MSNNSSENTFSPINENLNNKEQWRKIISDWEESKETQKNYCLRLNINLNTFVYWRGKFLTNVKSAVKQNKFVPVIVKSAEPKLSESLMIENKNGNKLHIPLSIKDDQLKKILAITGFNHA